MSAVRRERELLARAASRGMFRISDRIAAAKARHDRVLLADARTSMCDYRVALAAALGKTCDRNGMVRTDARTRSAVQS